MVLALLLAAFLQAPATATVRGKLLDAETGAPIAYGHVVLRPGGAGTDGDTFSATADGLGVYEVTKIAPGTYLARAGRAGYMAASYEGSVKLAAGQVEKDVNFRLSKPVVISGTVTDAEGEPVDQATVYAMQRVYRRGRMELQPRRPIQTNDRGEFRLRDLPPGRYYVTAYKLGYSGAGSPPLAAVLYPNASRLEDGQPVKLAPGEERPDVNFVLGDAKLYKISGRFVDRETGQPFTNVRFGADAASRISPPGRAGQMLPDGTFEITDLAPGSYLLGATVQTASGQMAYSRPIELTGDMTGLAVAIGKGATIKGRVRVDGAELPEKLAVRLVYRNPLGGSAQTFPTVTKPDGSFEFEHIQPGTYDWLIDRFPPAPLETPPTLFVANGDAGIVVPDSASTVEAALTIDFRVAAVSGKISDAGGPVTVALIPADAARRATDRYFRQAKANRDGSFKLEGVIPGDYYIAAWLGDDAGITMEPEVFTRLQKLATRITVEPSGAVTQDVQVTKELRALCEAY